MLLRQAATTFICAVMAVTAFGCKSQLPTVHSALTHGLNTYSKMPDEVSPPPRRVNTSVDADTPPPVSADERVTPGELSLEKARVIALDHNPDIDAAYARLLASRAAIDEARSRFHPVLSFSHTSTRTFLIPASRNRLASSLLPTTPILPTDISSPDFPVTTILNALTRPLFGGGSPGGDSNSFSEHSSSLTGSWVVFDGFVRDAEMLAAKNAFRATSASLDDVRRIITAAVDTAYFQVQLADERIKIAKADEEFSSKQLEETRKLQQAGRATQADVDNFYVRMLDAKTRLTNASGAKETGRVVLAELLGLSNAFIPDNVTLSALKEESQEEMTPPEAVDWITRALNARPDINEAEYLLEQARQNLNAAKGLYLPTLSVSGSWGFDQQSTIRYGSDDQSSAASLELRWDIYTGGARRSRVEVGHHRVNEFIAFVRKLNLAVQSEVRQAVIDVVDAQQRISLQRESLKTATENRRIVEAGYVAGKETLNRLNEAQRDYVAAQANLARARINLRQAWTDLRSAAADQAGP